MTVLRRHGFEPLIHGGFDLLLYSTGFIEDVVTGDAKHGEAHAAEFTIASLIAADTFFGEMVTAVDFDDELECQAAEINGKGFERMFAAKFLTAAAAVSDHCPNDLGELVGIGALLAGEGDGGRAWGPGFAGRIVVHGCVS